MQLTFVALNSLVLLLIKKYYQSNEHVSHQIYQQYKSRLKQQLQTGEKRRKAIIPNLAAEKGFYPWMTFRGMAEQIRFILT